MNHQLMLMPAQDGAPFEWLHECLNAAYPVEGAAGSPSARRKAPVANAYPLPSLNPRLNVSRPAMLRDRRADARSKMSVYRSATLRWDGREVLCLIRNLSSTGMMCRLLADLAVGDRVEVEMRSGDCIPGSVIWAADGQFGIRFDQDVDVAALLNPRTQSDARVQRMPRLSADCAATLKVGDSRLGAVLLDLSQGGAKIEAAGLCQGDEVTLHVAGLEARSGTVRWVDDACAGIAFHSPIPFNALARWAVERPVDQRVGTGSAPE